MKVMNIEKRSREVQKETITVCEAGRLGGLETLRRYGRCHFVTAGRLGQRSMAGLHTADDRRRWGAMGGRPKKPRLTEAGETRQYR